MCQGFRERKIRTGGRVLLAGVNLYVGYKLRVATADTVQSGTDNTRTVKQKLRQYRSFLPLPRAVCRKTGRNRSLLRSLSKTNTRKRNFAVNPWTARTHAVHGLAAIPIFTTHLPIGFIAESGSPTIHDTIAKSISVNYSF
jgi:hypothetical protein